MNVLIAAMQLLVAAAFLSIPLVRHRYGATAMAGAQAELERQGVRPTVLAENGMRFDAGGHETAVPVTVAAVMAALAALNLVAAGHAHLPNVVLQSVVLAGSCLILYSQVTATRSVQAAFRRKGDPMLARVDVPALLKAAEDGFPAWTWTLQKARHVVAFGASIIVLAATFAA